MSYTFKKNNSNIKDAYNNIWNQLPYNAKSALSSTSTDTLNDKGRALKQGLDYLKALS